MNTLLMDTSSSNMLVCLNASGNLIEGQKFDTSKHLETLMPSVEDLLSKKGFSVQNIDYLGVVVGPGSFTGIRIAVATAKAMMMVNKKIKAVAVNSLELMAKSYLKNNDFSKTIMCVIPTTIKKVYYAKFNIDNRLCEDGICEVDKIKEIAGDCTVVSNKDIIDGAIVYNVTNKDLNVYVEEKILSKDFADKLSPQYIGLSQAEEQLKMKENK